MSTLRPEIAADVAAQCNMAAAEIGQAFSRALDRNIEAAVGEPETLSYAALALQLSGPGLAIVLHVGEVGVAIVVPEASRLLPAWYSSPDPTGQSKLATLAQELGMLVLPGDFMADDFQAARAAHLATALHEGGAAHGAGLLRLALKSSVLHGEALIVWPLANPKNIWKTDSDGPTRAGVPAAAAATQAVSGTTSGEPVTPAMPAESAERLGASAMAPLAPAVAEVAITHRDASPIGRERQPRGPSLRQLPAYTRSLLKIQVPLSVTLASKKQPVGQILELGPGSIIQFEKSCEEMLDLNVSNLPIARGEAVKVGEKFGLRVTSLILPGERFKVVRPGKA